MISNGCHLRAAELGRRDHQRKKHEARAWKTPQTVSYTMEIVLGGRGPALRFGPSPKLEGEGAWRLTLAGCRLKFPGFVPCTKVL